MNVYVLDTNGVPVAPQSQQIFGLIVTSYTSTTSMNATQSSGTLGVTSSALIVRTHNRICAASSS
jgi:hypothetical protein